MSNHNSLPCGVVSLALSLLSYYLSRRVLYPIKLAQRTPVSPVGQVQEGMVQVVGRAVGEPSKRSYLLGLNCLATHTKMESYDSKRSKDKWMTEWQAVESVPFFVEDGSGRIYVDTAGAAFQLVPDVELTTGERWCPTPRQRAELSALQWNRDGLEARMHDLYFDNLLLRSGLSDLPGWMRRAAVAGHGSLAKAQTDPVLHQQALVEGYREPISEAEREEIEKRYTKTRDIALDVRRHQLRITEQNLLPGDAVYVLGSAVESPRDGQGAHPITIRKVHPSDTFVIGEGTPDEVHARIRKESRYWVLMALAFFLASLFLLYTHYAKTAGG